MERFESAAGWIQNLGVQGHVQIIFSRAESERSNHYHLTDSHTLHVVSGLMQYWEQPVTGDSKTVYREVGPGESVFTGPMVAHTTRFPIDTMLVSVSARNRSHEEHEADVVRVACLAPPTDRELACKILLRAGLDVIAKMCAEKTTRPGEVEAAVTTLLNDSPNDPLLYETKHAIRRWRKPINGPEDFRAEARRLLG